MKVAIYGSGIAGPIIFAIALFLFSQHRLISIWLGFASVVVMLFSVTLYWHSETISKPKLVKPTFTEKIQNVTFSLGERGMSAGYRRDSLKEPKEPFNFGEYKPVKLYIKDGNLFADVKVYGGSGLPPIEIIENELINKPIDWDFNSNDKALEIVDQNQNPIYQFYYKTPSHIVVNGVFPFPGGLVLANQEGATLNPILPSTFSLKRIFRYPSWQFPGEYEQNDR